MTAIESRTDARHLTRREETVLVLVGRGLSTRAIAERLALSPATVDGYVDSAMTRLAARTRAQAALMVVDPVAAGSVVPFAEIACEHERHLLLLLASGSTVGSAAWTVGWSRRTAVRRLSALRRAYRASTIPQLLVALASTRAPAADTEMDTDTDMDMDTDTDTDTDGRVRNGAGARARVRP